MKNKNIQVIIFFVLLIIFTILTARLLGYFFQPLAMAGILAVIFFPLYKFFTKKLKYESLSAFIVIILIIIIIVIPLYFLGKIMIGEMISFYGQNKGNGMIFDRQFLVGNLPYEWQPEANNIVSLIFEKVSLWTQSLTSNISEMISDITGFFLSCFLVLFGTFYFLKDCKKIKSFLVSFLSLSVDNEHLLINRLVSSIRGIIVGKFSIAFLQGLVAMAGFLFVGIPNVLFLGFLTMISSFVPIIGTGLVVLPVIIYLLLFKSFIPALILFIWYAVVHFSIDNIVTPKIIGSTTQIHPLLILLSILGGIELFGALGFFFGPIIVTIFLTLLESYKINYISS